MMPTTHELADKIYDILSRHLGGSESGRVYFIECFTKDECREFRLGGVVGPKIPSGLKLRNNGSGLYVDYYQEHKSPKFDNLCTKLNAALKELS